MGTCDCGRTGISGQQCKQCAIDDHHAQSRDNSPYADRVVDVECTACNTQYVQDDDATCPSCGSARRRYVGPLDGETTTDGGREAFLNGDSHWCDICSQNFQTLTELSTHDCTLTDGGYEASCPECGGTNPREHAAGSLAPDACRCGHFQRRRVAVVINGPNPAAYHAWARDQGGDAR